MHAHYSLCSRTHFAQQEKHALVAICVPHPPSGFDAPCVVIAAGTMALVKLSLRAVTRGVLVKACVVIAAGTMVFRSTPCLVNVHA